MEMNDFNNELRTRLLTKKEALEFVEMSDPDAVFCVAVFDDSDVKSTLKRLTKEVAEYDAEMRRRDAIDLDEEQLLAMKAPTLRNIAKDLNIQSDTMFAKMNAKALVNLIWNHIQNQRLNIIYYQKRPSVAEFIGKVADKVQDDIAEENRRDFKLIVTRKDDDES